jgi:hypothetical protein
MKYKNFVIICSFLNSPKLEREREREREKKNKFMIAICFIVVTEPGEAVKIKTNKSHKLSNKQCMFFLA